MSSSIISKYKKTEKPIGEGTYGVVYKAEWDTVVVAVKVLQQSMMAMDDRTVEEFEKEVDFLQRTRHPHVVRFFGAGTDPHGSPFLVLEFISLGSLHDLIDRGLGVVLRETMAHAKQQERGRGSGDNGDDGGAGSGDGGGDRVALLGGGDSGSSSVEKEGAGGDDNGLGSIGTTWDLKLRLLQHVAHGMAFIHSLGQVHR